MNFLLDARNSPPEPDFALRVGEDLRAGRELPSAELWRETAAGHAQDIGAGQGHGPEHRGARARRHHPLRGPVLRRRAAGWMGRVTTTVAYDYGRAVNLARWGLSARFCNPHEAEQAIVYAGALSKSAYHSWNTSPRRTRWGGCCASTTRSTARSTSRMSSPTVS